MPAAYAEGYSAYFSMNTNPYHTWSENYRDWQLGFEDAQAYNRKSIELSTWMALAHFG
jgi:hypothetical protein